jgi:hypothetical protein
MSKRGATKTGGSTTRARDAEAAKHLPPAPTSRRNVNMTIQVGGAPGKASNSRAFLGFFGGEVISRMNGNKPGEYLPVDLIPAQTRGFCAGSPKAQREPINADHHKIEARSKFAIKRRNATGKFVWEKGSAFKFTVTPNAHADLIEKFASVTKRV